MTMSRPPRAASPAPRYGDVCEASHPKHSIPATVCWTSDTPNGHIHFCTRHAHARRYLGGMFEPVTDCIGEHARLVNIGAESTPDPAAAFATFEAELRARMDAIRAECALILHKGNPFESAHRILRAVNEVMKERVS